MPIKRCYLCKFCIGHNEICLKLAEKRAKTIKIIVHMQAEQCPEYDPREK